MAQTFGDVMQATGLGMGPQNVINPQSGAVIGQKPGFQPPQQAPQQRPQQAPSGGGGGDPVAQARAQGRYQGWPDWQVAADLKAHAGDQQQPQAPDVSVFDKMIQPAIDSFESLIGTTQQASANTQTQLGTQRNTELDTEKSQFAGQQQDLSRQQTTQTDAANNAIEEAKRMYAEMSQGTLARYGSTTGTGAFLTEQLGQSVGRNIASLHQGLNQSLQDINDKITQVKQTGELAIRGTNERFDQAIQTEKDNLQKYIGQIKGQEGMLQANKAQMASQAIQHYQDTVTNLNAQREQQQQAWATAQLNAETQLKIYGQKGTSLLNNVQSNQPNYNQIATGGLGTTDINQKAPTTPGDTGSLSRVAQPNAFQNAVGGASNFLSTPVQQPQLPGGTSVFQDASKFLSGL